MQKLGNNTYDAISVLVFLAIPVVLHEFYIFECDFM